MSEARFMEPKTIHVTVNAGHDRLLRGERIFLCVGPRACIPDIPGLAAWAEDARRSAQPGTLARQLIILGDGYGGLDFRLTSHTGTATIEDGNPPIKLVYLLFNGF